MWVYARACVCVFTVKVANIRKCVFFHLFVDPPARNTEEGDGLGGAEVGGSGPQSEIHRVTFSFLPLKFYVYNKPQLSFSLINDVQFKRNLCFSFSF